jgi:hypothetical protein
MRDTASWSMRENKTGPSMKHASSRQVFDYWNERRGDRIAPERGDIEPGPIRRALGDTFILGQDERRAFRFRLAGTRTCALFCRELKGADFTQLWAKAEQETMRAHIAAVAEETAGFIAGATARNADGAAAELEMLLLPLVQRDRSQTRLLGVLAPLIPPYWLGVTPIEGLTCGTIRNLGPESGHIAAPRLVPGTENGRIRRGLIVYDGGRS